MGGGHQKAAGENRRNHSRSIMRWGQTGREANCLPPGSIGGAIKKLALEIYEYWNQRNPRREIERQAGSDFRPGQGIFEPPAIARHVKNPGDRNNAGFGRA